MLLCKQAIGKRYKRFVDFLNQNVILRSTNQTFTTIKIERLVSDCLKEGNSWT